MKKIFTNLDPRQNRLPIDTSKIVRRKPARIPSIVNPDFFVNNHPGVQANLRQFDPVVPSKIRADLRMRLHRSVEQVNRQIRNNILFKGITFAVDERSGRSYAVVINKRTGEVLQQIPGDKFLDRAARLKDAAGLFSDITV